MMKLDLNFTTIATILVVVVVGSIIAKFVERATGIDIPGLG